MTKLTLTGIRTRLDDLLAARSNQISDEWVEENQCVLLELLENLDRLQSFRARKHILDSNARDEYDALSNESLFLFK